MSNKPYVKIDLNGPQGNAFVVLGMCQDAARQACWTDKEIKDFVDDATSGDYEHLLEVAREHFQIDNGDDEIDIYDEDDEGDYNNANDTWYDDDYDDV